MSFFKALNDFNSFLDPANKKARKLVFYSEKGIYLRYYEGLISKILEKSDLEICYLTADLNDPIFQTNNNRIKPFYINNFESSLFPRLDSKVVVMTLPDLNQFYIKKTNNKDVNHVYVFHAIGSTHLQYNFGAFDYYDTIFCVGPHQEQEIRKTEALYNLKPKTLINYGYPYLENVYSQHQRFLNENKAVEGKKRILVAPTWGKTCILETCIDKLITALQGTEFEVFIRPHPEFVKRRRKVVNRIAKNLKRESNIKMELDLVSGINVHNADFLITDWSGIAFEYAFGTERPVLFINTPLKIDNPKYQELDITPLEVFARDQIGTTVDMNQFDNIVPILNSFSQESGIYRDRIVDFRNKYIFNWMKSSEIGAEYIIKLCDK
ncbi:MAG: CDP-glycerol glycerophosphotransferase family protein [Bacteroidota bacterium]